MGKARILTYGIQFIPPHSYNSLSNSDCITGFVTYLETNISQDTGDLKQLHMLHTICIRKFKWNYEQRSNITEIKNILYEN